jgi:hypothetical protein
MLNGMNTIQRVILLLIALYLLVGGLITFVSPSIGYFEFFTYLFIILVAGGFFYFGFSPPPNKMKRRSTDKKPTEIIEQAEVPIYNRKNSKNSEKLDNLINYTNARLYKLSSVFPFDLFPNDVIINQKQVQIVNRYFFFARRDFPILIKNILVPVVETSIFFASLSMEVVGFEQNPDPVKFLKKDEALRAKAIIMGLIVCDKEGIDLSKYSPEDILAKVEEIGKVRIG